VAAFRAPVCFIKFGLIPYRHRYCTYLYYSIVPLFSKGHSAQRRKIVKNTLCVAREHILYSERTLHIIYICACVCVCVCVCVYTYTYYTHTHTPARPRSSQPYARAPQGESLAFAPLTTFSQEQTRRGNASSCTPRQQVVAAHQSVGWKIFFPPKVSASSVLTLQSP
jgi:hypothetical protein